MPVLAPTPHTSFLLLLLFLRLLSLSLSAQLLPAESDDYASLQKSADELARCRVTAISSDDPFARERAVCLIADALVRERMSMLALKRQVAEERAKWEQREKELVAQSE